MNFKAIILAAGKGTRMKSKYPKVVHKVCGKEMVNHVISVSKKSGVNDIVAILGHESDVVKEKLPKDTMIAMQTEQLGTGHAVMMAKEYINDNDTIVVLCGDTPLVKEETLKRLFDYHIEHGYHATVLTTTVDNPTGYGRIIRDENYQSNVRGLIPAGEGAGYAGGITSAAIDGIKIFEFIGKNFHKPEDFC